MGLGSGFLSKIISASGRRGMVLSGALSLSMLASPMAASAKDIGAAAARAIKITSTDTAVAKLDKIKDIIHTVVGMTDKGAPVAKKNIISGMMGRTAVHESLGLTQPRQISAYVNKKPVYGPARSYFQVEPKTAHWLTTGYAFDLKNVEIEGSPGKFKKVLRRPEALSNIESATGISREELKNLNLEQVSSMLEENLLYAGTMTRYKYKTIGPEIPEGLNAQGNYWVDYYQGTGSKEKKDLFISNNKAFEEKIGFSVDWGQSDWTQKQTAGLTGVLDKNKTQHQVQDVKEKTKHLWKFGK